MTEKINSGISILNILKNTPNYKVNSVPNNAGEFNILFNEKWIGKVFDYNSLCIHLEQFHKISWDKILSDKLIIEDGIFAFLNGVFYVIDIQLNKKEYICVQELQSCDFKYKQWQKLLVSLKCKVEYIYLLDSGFEKNHKYKDILNYVLSSQCKYFFDNITLGDLGLVI